MYLYFPPLPALVPVVVAYLGPDTLMPLGSALAAILGVILLFGRRALGLARGGLRKARGQGPEVGPDTVSDAAADAGADADTEQTVSGEK